MKEVIAVIRMQKINATKQACAAAGISSFTARKVQGRGRGDVDFRVLQAAQAGREEAIAQLGQGPLLMPKRLLTFVVSDEQVELLVNTLISVNKTGNHGDGKIFVKNITDAVRVRTGERGLAALDEK
jgi:nitrogen regulatory protein PII 2